MKTLLCICCGNPAKYIRREYIKAHYYTLKGKPIHKERWYHCEDGDIEYICEECFKTTARA